MKDYEQRWEERIDRELKALPELEAPPALTARILSVVARRAARPWYFRSWQAWPVPAQAASIPILLVLFGGLCWGVLALTHAVAAVPAVQNLAAEAAGLRVFWRMFEVLGDAAMLCFRHLGAGFLAAVLMALFLVYAACMGLGTLSLRLVMARTDKT